MTAHRLGRGKCLDLAATFVQKVHTEGVPQPKLVTEVSRASSLAAASAVRQSAQTPDGQRYCAQTAAAPLCGPCSGGTGAL